MPNHPNCSAPGCSKSFYAKALCRVHYMRMYRLGSLSLPERTPKVKPPCSIDGCPEPFSAKGLCRRHYYLQLNRARREASRPPLEERIAIRFWAKVTKTDTCWLWTAVTLPNGYGLVTINKRKIYVHRWSYEATKGPIPDGLVIDHLCRVRNCVNPDHLEAVTNQVNILRGYESRHS